MLTPDDVQGVLFGTPPAGRRGYDEDQVDELLDAVALALTEGRPPAEVVLAAHLTPPPLGEQGYDEHEVDAFLDQLLGVPAPVAPPTVPPRGLLARLTGRGGRVRTSGA